MASIRIVCLGGGQDVGRSCVVVTLGGRTIMLDCGMHMGYKDARRFPDVAQLGAHSGEQLTGLIDCVFITHFHLDHIGALPHLTEVLGYDGPVYMTAPTAVIGNLLLKDYAQIMSEKKGEACYQPAAVDACMRRAQHDALGETIIVDDDLELRTHYAGHVLGAVMVSVCCGGQSIVYTGDFNSTADRHLGCARIERLRPHALITESTYATSIRESRRCRETELLTLIHRTVAARGRVLIPSFAIGRTQELLFLLDMYWERMGLRVPIYVSAGIIRQANLYYRTSHPFGPHLALHGIAPHTLSDHLDVAA